MVTDLWMSLNCRKRPSCEPLNDLYSSPNIVRVIKFEKNEMGGEGSAYGGVQRRIQGFGGET